MTLDDLLSLASARLAHLDAMRAEAARVGDVARVAEIDVEAADTQATLTALLQLI